MKLVEFHPTSVLGVYILANLDIFVFLHELAHLATFENYFANLKNLKKFQAFFNFSVSNFFFHTQNNFILENNATV